MQLTKNFTTDELQCDCCHKCPMQPEFLGMLQQFRDLYGPVGITSGYRCQSHNQAIGGVNSSMHVLGRAVDINWSTKSGAEKHKMLMLALKIFKGIGLHKSFLHVDNREDGVTWFY